jgi:hypothetical protein
VDDHHAADVYGALLGDVRDVRPIPYQDALSEILRFSILSRQENLLVLSGSDGHCLGPYFSRFLHQLGESGDCHTSNPQSIVLCPKSYILGQALDFGRRM